MNSQFFFLQSVLTQRQHQIPVFLAHHMEPSLAMETRPVTSMFMFDDRQVNDTSAIPEVTTIPTNATSFSQVGEAIQSSVEPSVTLVTPPTPVVPLQAQSTYSVDASSENIIVSGAVNSSPPTQPSIPPGAVIIRHTGNTISHLSKRRRGKIPSNIRIFSRGMLHMSTSTHVAPSQMPPWPQPAIPIRPCAPPYPLPELGPQVGESASTPGKKRGRPPSSGKKQKMQS